MYLESHIEKEYERAAVNNFEFYNPTRIVFGSGEANKIGKFAAKWGKKALLVTSRSSVIKLGIFAQVKASLQEFGIETIDLAGVDPNPRLSTVTKGVKLCVDGGADMIVAVGGGSVIDCSKAIAFCRYDDGDFWDFFTGKRMPNRALPVLSVLTISGTGSEMNSNCVITNESLAQKYVTSISIISPKVSIIDPQLMKSVPGYLTACGMVDTISHVLEKYFDGTKNTPMQDRISEGVVLTVIENENILSDLTNIDARANLAWASTIALNNIANAGRGFGAFDAHTIELEISAKYDIAHGAGLAVVHPAWMIHLCGKDSAKFVQFAKRIFNIEQEDMSDYECGLKGIEALKERFKAWGMPQSLTELGVPKSNIEKIAQDAVSSPKGKTLVFDEVLSVLKGCLE